MKTWKAQNIENSECIGFFELEGGEYFEIVQTEKCLVFGNFTNTGFLQSGYMEVDDCFSLDENLQELIEDLEVYYRDGKDYTSRIVCNDRM